MLIRLTALDFRNLEPLTFDPGNGSHLLLGGNGAGKTSLLEALYIVSTTKSFRTHRLGEAVRHGATGFELSAEVDLSARRRLQVVWRDGARSRSVNGKEGSLGEHLETLPIVAWTAADTEILSGAPLLRRRLLDRGLLNERPASLVVMNRYREALAAKRELLQRGRRSEEIEPWNEVLALAGAELAELRAGHVTSLGRRLEEVLAEVELPCRGVRLRYRPSAGSALEGAPAFARALAQGLPAERARGQSLLGPHRDDLEILWHDRPVRQVASAGERKALSLALTAAQARLLEQVERSPVVLLDDADAELAQDTLERLWPAFAGARQLLASSNRPEVWRGIETTRRWHVERGALTPLNP